MKSLLLCQALRQGGLSDATARSIIQNPILAEKVAIFARLEVINDERKILEKGLLLPNPKPKKRKRGKSTKGYRGKIQFQKVPELVAELRKKKIEPSISALAKELNTSISNFTQTTQRHPEVAKIIEDALNTAEVHKAA
jgi:hypothetical protein